MFEGGASLLTFNRHFFANGESPRRAGNGITRDLRELSEDGRVIRRVATTICGNVLRADERPSTCAMSALQKGVDGCATREGRVPIVGTS